MPELTISYETPILLVPEKKGAIVTAMKGDIKLFISTAQPSSVDANKGAELEVGNSVVLASDDSRGNVWGVSSVKDGDATVFVNNFDD